MFACSFLVVVVLPFLVSCPHPLGLTEKYMSLQALVQNIRQQPALRASLELPTDGGMDTA
eukprot:m.53665 g.53665  ORF g.53665 m.53665 type:complete len:60 (+) comp48610_c0_seq3:42-221(+)